MIFLAPYFTSPMFSLLIIRTTNYSIISQTWTLSWIIFFSFMLNLVNFKIEVFTFIFISEYPALGLWFSLGFFFRVCVCVYFFFLNIALDSSRVLLPSRTLFLSPLNLLLVEFLNNKSLMKSHTKTIQSSTLHNTSRLKPKFINMIPVNYITFLKHIVLHSVTAAYSTLNTHPLFA